MTASALGLRKVHLHGHLSEGIGETITLAFRAPVDAVRLLELNFPGFLARFRTGYYRVVALMGDGRERVLGEDRLDLGFTGDLAIIPVAEGAAGGKRKGILGTILGAVIIGAALFFSGGTLAAALPGFLGAAGATFGNLAQIGLSLALNGLATLLTPTPNTDYSEVDQRRSFVFNGPVNLTQPGGVLPLIYGKMLVGTYTVSSSLDTEMLGRTPTGQQEPVDSTFTFRVPEYPITVDMDDLVVQPTGAVLTEFGGQTITANTSIVFGDLTVVINRDDADDVLTITYTGTTHPASVNSQQSFDYTVAQGGTNYEGTLKINIGSPATYAPTFGAGYVPGKEVTGLEAGA